MAKLSEAFPEEVPVKVELGAIAVEMVVRPGVYTEAYEAELLAASKASPSPTGADDINHLLCDLVVSWDLEDDAGPLPLTVENLRLRLPYAVGKPLAAAVVRAVSQVGEAPTAGKPS